MTDHTNLANFNMELSTNWQHLDITHTNAGGKIRVSKVEGGLVATPYLYADGDEVDTEEQAKQDIRSLRNKAGAQKALEAIKADRVKQGSCLIHEHFRAQKMRVKE